MIRVDNMVTTKCSARPQPAHDMTPKTPRYKIVGSNTKIPYKIAWLTALSGPKSNHSVVEIGTWI